MIKIDFRYDTPHGVFGDALILPDDHALTEAEIESMKEQRRDAWIRLVTTPVPVSTQIILDGNVYQRLEGIPQPGATLREIDGIWHYLIGPQQA